MEKKVPKEEKRKLSKEQEGVIKTELGLDKEAFKSLKKTYEGLLGRDDRAFMNMLRSTNKNHYTLNQMVDRKARILLSVNALILTLLIREFVTNDLIRDWKFYLLVFFGTACFFSIVFAVLAVAPEKSHGKLNVKAIKQKKGNPLFFGNFKNMSGDSYENTMMEMVNDRDFIYRSMIQDIYYLGQVLERKRKYLQSSLYIFLIGVCVTLLLSFLLHFLAI